MDAETAVKMGREGQIDAFCEIMRAEQSANLPDEAKTGRYRLGTTIMVSAESVGELYRNPDLPLWFAARVCMPPAYLASDHHLQWHKPEGCHCLDFCAIPLDEWTDAAAAETGAQA